MINRMNPFTRMAGGLLMVSMLVAGTGTAQENGEAPPTRPRAASEVDPQARQLFDKAIELMEYKQYERGLAMLNTVVRDYQGSIIAHKAHMAMGKHHLDQRATAEALSHFLLLTRVLTPEPGEKQPDDVQDLYHESLFQAGFAQYQAGQYSAGFPLFRRLTEVAGKTKWANQAYFYIGMSHYRMGNWNKAIDSLSSSAPKSMVPKVMISAASKSASDSTRKSPMPISRSCASLVRKSKHR